MLQGRFERIDEEELACIVGLRGKWIEVEWH